MNLPTIEELEQDKKELEQARLNVPSNGFIPTEEDLKQARLNEYKDNRANHFNQALQIGDQLDMLWHELSETGSINKDGEWFKSIKSIKDAHPKPK